jgi:hypothetical protein
MIVFFGISGFVSAVLSGMLLFVPGLNSPFTSLIVLGSGILLTFWSFFSRGCKHLPYWITLFAGGGMLVFSVTSAAGGGFLFKDGGIAAAGLSVIVLSRIISLRIRMNTRRYYLGAGLFTAAAVLGLGALSPEGRIGEELSYDKGKAALMDLLHPGAADYIEDINGFVDDIVEDENLDPEEKEAEILSLNKRITEMEAELALFEEMREENRASRREIALLQEKVEKALSREGGGDSEGFIPVSTISQAVQPDIPVVRDFAAALAADFPGSFYSSHSYGDPSPGSIGMKQIINIHRYISSEWKYVNDPMFVNGDYYSPAGRTIATGLAGDCDDYAILTASAIEAIGGKTRIMGGSCAEGGHAWPEVYIGGPTAWNEAMQVISTEYPGRRIRRILDDSGRYWLSLDWQLGIYSCGGASKVLYQSDRR